MICISKLASPDIGPHTIAPRVIATALIAAGLIATSATHSAEVAAESKGASRSLDLRPPLITRIFTPQQIDMILARSIDPQLEYVEVEAARIDDVPFVDQSARPVEAAFKEVIRWFAPYPTVLAASVNAAPDATDPYRAVPISISAYHPSFPPPYSQR
jgi:hypothetical protein